MNRKAGPAGGRRVTLYTKADCGLCTEAVEALLRLRKRIHFQLDFVDIEADPSTFARFWDRVPVVTVDGKEVAAAPLDEGLLREILAS
ncbi:MAG: glutaredoxin family protein [Dehalococcoidia bacterium]|nr:glutaredoxin family protein [Dehalococcoidia bacterium]